MDSLELARGIKHSNFIGVFPINKIPNIKISSKPIHFAVNNQTANLPGQHWIGVSVFKNACAYVYDPLGLPPPQYLVKQLYRRGVRRIEYNMKQDQPLGSTNCGKLVQKHLNKRVYK